MSERIRAYPLWIRYLVAVVVSVALFTGLVIFDDTHNGPLSEPAVTGNATQEAELNGESRAVMVQQEAPHTVRVSDRATPDLAAAGAVTDYFQSQVTSGFIAGPVDGRASCRPATAVAGESGSALRCEIHAGSGANTLMYPFDVRVEPATHRATYCQVVTPAYPVRAVPVSPSCR